MTLSEGKNEPDISNEERAERVKEIRKAGPVEFIRKYGFVLEPRPPITDEQLDLDFDTYLKNLKDGKYLNEEALQTMPDEVVGVGDLPFDLWDYQEDLILWFDWLVAKSESGLTEKSRDMGYTWCYVWWAVYHFVAGKGFSVLFGSKKEAAVDNGTVSSIFGKLDYAIEKLPAWLKPLGYDRKKHRTRLRILNPENDNHLVGDSQTADFGASERHTAVIPDETALWDTDPSGTISATTHTAFYGSSVRGENHFKRLRDRLEARSKSLVRRLEWDLNPTHTEAWFKAMQARMDEADFAREVLIDYQASVKGKYYPICNLVKIVKGLEWQAGWPSFLSWDYGVRDNTALIWWQHNWEGTEHHMMFCYTNTGKPIEFYIPFVLVSDPDETIPKYDEYGPVTDASGNVVYEKLSKKWQYTEEDYRFIKMLKVAGVSELAHRGDPAGRNRNQDTAMSVVQKLAEVGIYVESDTKQNDYLSRREALTEVLLHTLVNVEEMRKDRNGNETGSGGAWPAFNAIQQSKYPERNENSQATTVPAAPVHDWTSHFRSSAEYYAVGEQPPQEDEKQSFGSLAIFGVSRSGR